MAIMKRDVNFGLFILVIAALFVFAGYTTYYQSTFENLSTNYDTKLDELTKVTTNLQMEKNKLNQTSFQLQVKAEREQDLSNKYDEMRTLKEGLEKDKAKLESELAKKKAELAKTNVELATAEDKLTEAQDELNEALTLVDVLRDQLITCQDDLDECSP